MELVKGKIALLTGAAGGIGAASAIAFAKNGAKAVLIADIDENKAKATIETIRAYCDAKFYKADVTKEEQVKAIFDDIEKTYGRLDILVTCAGITSLQKFEDLTIEHWDKVMDINLKGTVLFSKEAMRIMRKQKYGRIVLFSSISGQVGGIRVGPAYACSKAGISCLAKSLAKMGAKETVTANSVAPGIAMTDMTRSEGFSCSADEVPLGYIASPEEVSDVVLFLASDLSRYVTGQCISVNGGMFMGF